MSNSVIITSAVRTAVGSLGRSLKNIPGDELGSTVISEAIKSSKLQKEYLFFYNMLKGLEKKKKKTPGNGFAMMKCKEKLAELDKIFDDIDYAAQITYD